MTLQRMLQFNIALMAFIGTLVLGMGQQSWFLPLMAATAAILSLIYTDKLGKLRLNRNVANLAAILAVIGSLNSILRNDVETQLLAIANLLIYLQIVLMFQEKSLRVYWQLSILSLLQVVVASVLNLGFEFGLLLGLYMIVALSGLSLLFIYQETLRFGGQAMGSDQADNAQEAWAAATRWPQGTRHDLLGKRFIARVAIMACVTTAITIVLFYAVPRGGQAKQLRSVLSPEAMTGFSDNVELGSLGKIAQSDLPAMRVNFYEHRNDGVNLEPYSVHSIPYFRGVALEDYALGTWSPMEDNRENNGRSEELGSAPPGPYDPVVQVIQLSPSSAFDIKKGRVLFNAGAAFRIEGRPKKHNRFDAMRQEVRRHNGMNPNEIRGRLDYAHLTTAFRDGRQIPITPVAFGSQDPDILGRAGFPEHYLANMRRMPAQLTGGVDRWENLKALATKVIEEEEFPPEALAYEKIQALEDHFRSSDEYVYTLERPDVTPNWDPIEDFVTNQREGHCEYFASALVLMLRSQGIPARMVVGYKGGKFNQVGGYYQVLELNAHAWVEAHVFAEDLPEGFVHDHEANEAGYWLRLDPTPLSAEMDLMHRSVSFFDILASAKDFVQVSWNDWVVELDRERQHGIWKQAQEATAGIFSGKAWKKDVALLRAGDLGAVAQGPRGRLLLVLFVIGLWAAFRIWCGRWTFAVLRKQRTQQNPEESVPQAIHVPFYERLEELLDQIGVQRTPGQTQREFALAAGGQLAESAQTRHLAGLPRIVVDAFYRVRFGATPLAPTQTAEIEQALDQLQDSLTEETHEQSPS